MSDSSYSASTRHRRPYSTSGRPPTLEIVDDDWAGDTLSDDDVVVDAHEAAIATFLDEGDLDVDAVVVSTGHSGPGTSNSAAERRKREEGRWVDLGLDHFDGSSNMGLGLAGNILNNLNTGSGSGSDSRVSNGAGAGGSGSGEGGGTASGGSGTGSGAGGQ